MQDFVKEYFVRDETIYTSEPKGKVKYSEKKTAFFAFLGTFTEFGKEQKISRELLRTVYRCVVPRKYHITSDSDLGKYIKQYICSGLPDGSREKNEIEASARNLTEMHEGEDHYVWLSLIKKYPNDVPAKAVLEGFCGHADFGIKKNSEAGQFIAEWRKELEKTKGKFKNKEPGVVDYIDNDEGFYIAKIDVPGTCTNQIGETESYCDVKSDVLNFQNILKITWVRILNKKEPVHYKDYKNGAFERHIEVHANVTGDPSLSFANGECIVKWKLTLAGNGSFTLPMV